jgi:hypothetical protein
MEPPLTSPDDFDPMMDAIASAESVAELVWYRTHVARVFVRHPRRPELERMIDGITRVIRAKP